MQKLKITVLGISACALLVGMSGCASWQHGSDRTAGRAVDDRAITSKVEDGLHHEPVFKFSDVDVRTFNGVVQLSGFVNSDEQKRRAGEIAQRVDGVREVVNSIALKEQLSPTGRTNGVAPIHDANTTIDNTVTNSTVR